MMMNKTINKTKDFLKKETVFTIAAVLAVISCFFVKPSADYLRYIDFKTLLILLVMMVAVQLLKALDIFDLLVGKLLNKVHSIRGLVFIMVFGCFFASMLITNDISLLTLVPFAIVALKKAGRQNLLIPVVILQTIAANMGCMILPTASPHNILMFSLSGMSFQEFVMTLLPYWLLSFIVLTAACFFFPHETIKSAVTIEVSADRKDILKKTLSGVDWFLLLTFIAFFVLIGNLKNMPEVNAFFSRIVEGRELVCSILACQIISNVPTAMMMSGFGSRPADILTGINIGGLGTLIASMANLISYKIYAHEFNDTKGKYLLLFTLANVLLLIPMVLMYYVM